MHFFCRRHIVPLQTPLPRRLKAAAQLAPQPDPKLLITDGRQQTDGFGTTGQQPDTLVPWRYQTKNALYYDGAQREALPYSGGCRAAAGRRTPTALPAGRCGRCTQSTSSPAACLHGWWAAAEGVLPAAAFGPCCKR